ncbi:MAG TPA: HEAT repeat domain-containing protein [Thermoanaerobaculia bacterium]|nr:HEAT repeat domain-containing protein [Thermoanaerobaculia bacterium]
MAPHDDDEDDGGRAESDDLEAGAEWALPAEARAVLVASLTSPDAEVRLEAVEMLAHSLDDELAALGLAVARNDPEDEVRAAAASALAPALAAGEAAAAGGPPGPLSDAGLAAVRQGLRQLYFDGQASKEVRRRALEAAVQSPEPWQEGAARAALANADPEWRASAIFCMLRLPGFVAELIDALRDREPLVRLEAARAVGDAGLTAAGPRLLTLAQAADEEGLVRMAAMESLGMLGDRQAVGPLRELAATADPELAFAARSALARIAGWDREREEDEDDELA